MDSPAELFTETFKSLLELDKFELNEDDSSNLFNHVNKYIETINKSQDVTEGDKPVVSVDELITSMRKAQSEPNQNFIYISKNFPMMSTKWSEEELLEVHLKFRKDLSHREILAGQPIHESILKHNPPGVNKFKWGYFPYDVPSGVYTSLRIPEEIRLRPPFFMHTYGRFHNYLHYEEASQNYRARAYDLKNETLEVYNEEYFLLKHHNLSLSICDRLILKCSKYNHYLGAFIHDVIDEGYLIKMDKSIHEEGIDGLEFDIYVVPDLIRVTCSRRHHAIYHVMTNQDKYVQVLFPDLKFNFDLSRKKIDMDFLQLEWFDDRLNEEQKKAVINIMKAEVRPAPIILFGPPGTGKMSTIIEAILQIYKNLRDSKILVCGLVGDAAIAQRILDTQIIPKEEIWRLTSTHRMKQDMTEDVREVSELSNTITDGMYKKYRIVISSCYQSDRLRIYEEDKFDYLFIYNANLVDEPQSLICIRHLKLDGCLVLSGDPFCGEPLCLSHITKANGFDISLMERLLCREPYENLTLPDKQLVFDGRYKSILTKNYRTDFRLMKPSNNLFYNNELTCDIITPHWLLESMGVKNPLLFHPINSMTSESFKDETWNPNEILVCLSYLKRLIAAGVKPEQIAIITPLKEHEFKLDTACKANMFEGVDIWTHGKQLEEREVIIISTVRSKPDITDTFTERKFNMAMGRAKWMVILVGNENYMINHKFGLSYLEYAQEVSF